MSIYNPYEVDMEELLTDQENWEVFANKFISLPQDIKNILTFSSTSDYLKHLCENLNLNDKQSVELSRIIRDTLMGDLFIGEMSRNITTRMGLAPDKAQRIKDAVISTLFRSATKDIKKLQAERFPEKINNPISEKPDLKIEPEINRNNIVDLRNK